MNWKYVKPLASEDLIGEFETAVGYTFPESFRRCVLEHNGGRPEKRSFRTDREERCMKSFLSFNKGDRETVWMARNWLQDGQDRYVTFAVDNFGNLICFEKQTGAVVFYDAETATWEKASGSFEEFMESLFD